MLSKDTKGEELAEADRNHSTHENKKGQTKWPYNKAHATKEKEVEWPDALQNKWGWARQAKTEKQWHGQTIKTQASDQTRQTQSNNQTQAAVLCEQCHVSRVEGCLQHNDKAPATGPSSLP